MQKSARRVGNVVAMQQHNGDVVTPFDQDAVARRAFELYCVRGCEHVHDLDDWLLAESELLVAPNSTAA